MIDRMTYFGAKTNSGLYQAIISIMPAHETYIETHLGSGVIMKRKPPSLFSIGIDVDPIAINDFTRSAHVTLINRCCHNYLLNYPFLGNELIYCDPPYLISTRRSNRRYRYDYDTRQHIELIKILKSLSCSIIISGYPSALYNKFLKSWNKIELQVMTRGGVRTEVIWYNFKPDNVFWIKYAGKNFTDRQRIKRKALRWKNKYKNLPPHERLAILNAILTIDS